MIKVFVCILCVLKLSDLIGQQKYIIDDFLDGCILEYMYQKDADNVLVEAYKLYDLNKNLLISSDADNILKHASGIIKIGYKDLSDINISLIADHNFDGKQDIRILHPKSENDGSFSQGNYSYYLSSASTYKYNASLSDLANTTYVYKSSDLYVDKSKKQIVTQIGSGCCWYTFDTYEFRNNQLEKVGEIKEDWIDNPPYIERVGYEMQQGTKQSIKYKQLDTEHSGKIFLSFTTTNGKGMVKIFEFKDQLCYAFIEDKGRIYFAYPANPEKAKSAFIYHEKLNELEFSSGTVTYIVTNSEIRIRIKGKITTWLASDDKLGNLEVLKNLTFSNFKKQ